MATGRGQPHVRGGSEASALDWKQWEKGLKTSLVVHSAPPDEGSASRKPTTDRNMPPCKHCCGTHLSTRCRFLSVQCHHCHKCGQIPAIFHQLLKHASDSSKAPPKHSVHSGGAEGETVTPSELKDPMNNFRSVHFAGSKKDSD